MMGLIVPGGWEEFFRFIGEPYSGPMWPVDDNRNFFEVLLPKLKAAAEQFDMVPCPQQEHFDPQPWSDDENQLPGKPVPYFLKNATGPAYILGGMVCRPLITTAEANGRFAIGCIEGSSQHHASGIFAGEYEHAMFEEVHQAFHVVEGSVEFKIDGANSKLHSGELVYVPKATPFRFEITSRFVKMYVYGNGGGLVEFLQEHGRAHDSVVLPEKAEPCSTEVLRQLHG